MNRPHKQSMSELKLRRLMEHNARLKKDLARPRIRVSEASARYSHLLSQLTQLTLPHPSPFFPPLRFDSHRPIPVLDWIPGEENLSFLTAGDPAGP